MSDDKVNITPPAIPFTHTAFAAAVAQAAEKHGIKRFNMTYEPVYTGKLQSGQRINGDLKINYSSRDGRGRPCTNLSISLDTRLTHEIVTTPESSN